MAEGKVNINAGEIRSILANVAQTYATLSESIEALRTKKGEVNGYWQSAQASQFESELDLISASFANFNTKYSDVLTSLGHITSGADAMEATHAAAYSQYAGASN